MLNTLFLPFHYPNHVSVKGRRGAGANPSPHHWVRGGYTLDMSPAYTWK